jgi:hypothetical protein
MYWRASQYPELKDLSAVERKQIIAAVMREPGKASPRRFFGVLWVLIAVVILGGRLLPAFPTSDWRRWIHAVAAGATVWIYLLWVTNGALHRVVTKYLADRTRAS